MKHADFFIRSDGKFIRIIPREILYLECLQNYVRIVTHSQNYLALISMRQLEKELPEDLFCRVHRSYIVSLLHIQSFDYETVYLEKKTIPISANYAQALQNKVRVLVSHTRSRESSASSS